MDLLQVQLGEDVIYDEAPIGKSAEKSRRLMNVVRPSSGDDDSCCRSAPLLLFLGRRRRSPCGHFATN